MSLDVMAVLDDILECSVCLNRLQDPKRLPCGHIFCKKCLVPLRTKACPKCRQNFSTNVTDLPSDTTTVKLLESCKHRRACRNCKSNFAMQCHHCPLKLCEACLKKHTREISLEKQEILRANLPDDIIQSNQAQFCAEVMSQVKKSIEAAREKATTYLNYHYDEVGRLWQERMDNWNDFSLIQRAYNDLCSVENPRKPTLRCVPPALPALYESHEESEHAMTVIGNLQDDLDITTAELVGLQWKLSEDSAKSRKVLKMKLNEKQSAFKKTGSSTSIAFNTTGLEKAMDETSDVERLHGGPPKQLAEESPSPLNSSSQAPSVLGVASSKPAFGTPSAKPSGSSFSTPASFGVMVLTKATPVFSFGAAAVALPPPSKTMTLPETTDSIRHGGLDNERALRRAVSFEEERFEHVQKTRSKPNGKNGSEAHRNAHITLYSHRVLGLFSTPPLSFSLLNALTNDEPEQFPAADDDEDDYDEQKGENENMLDQKGDISEEKEGTNRNVESLEENKDNYDDDSEDDGPKQETKLNAQDSET